MQYSKTTTFLEPEDLKMDYGYFIAYNIVAYVSALLGFWILRKVILANGYPIPVYLLIISISISIFLGGYFNFKQALKETHKTIIKGLITKIDFYPYNDHNSYYLYLEGSNVKIEIDTKICHRFEKGDKIALHMSMDNNILRYEKI